MLRSTFLLVPFPSTARLTLSRFLRLPMSSAAHTSTFQATRRLRRNTQSGASRMPLMSVYSGGALGAAGHGDVARACYR